MCNLYTYVITIFNLIEEETGNEEVAEGFETRRVCGND